jgi:hypothetical protein
VRVSAGGNGVTRPEAGWYRARNGVLGVLRREKWIERTRLIIAEGTFKIG